MFSCDFCEIFKNTFSIEHLQTTASGFPVNFAKFLRILFLPNISWRLLLCFPCFCFPNVHYQMLFLCMKCMFLNEWEVTWRNWIIRVPHVKYCWYYFEITNDYQIPYYLFQILYYQILYYLLAVLSFSKYCCSKYF